MQQTRAKADAGHTNAETYQIFLASQCHSQEDNCARAKTRTGEASK